MKADYSIKTIYNELQRKGITCKIATHNTIHILISDGFYRIIHTGRNQFL